MTPAQLSAEVVSRLDNPKLLKKEHFQRIFGAALILAKSGIGDDVLKRVIDDMVKDHEYIVQQNARAAC